MIYSVMKEQDIAKVIPLYIDYYNKHEGGCWTYETAYKRIHQVWSREDSYCLILEHAQDPIGFAMGYFEQYDDISAYDLIEIVVAAAYQNKGIGANFMAELEKRVKEMGAAIIQLQAVNDEMHEHFYEKLHYKDAKNFVLKVKGL